MIGKCGYNYMKESLLIMHTRSKIQTSQNLIFKYLGISTNYTPQIVLFLGARCARTIRHLACIKVQHWNNHTTRRPTSSTTHHHHTISYTMIALLPLLLIICDAAWANRMVRLANIWPNVCSQALRELWGSTQAHMKALNETSQNL